MITNKEEIHPCRWIVLGPLRLLLWLQHRHYLFTNRRYNPHHPYIQCYLPNRIIQRGIKHAHHNLYQLSDDDCALQGYFYAEIVTGSGLGKEASIKCQWQPFRRVVAGTEPVLQYCLDRLVEFNRHHHR